MIIKELFKETKFKRLFATLALIVPLEILSLFSVHLPWFVEYPLFAGIIYFFGREVIIGGLQSLARLKFSNKDFLTTRLRSESFPRRSPSYAGQDAVAGPASFFLENCDFSN